MQAVSRTRLNIRDFILPYFVVGGKNIKDPVKSMPGIYRFSADNLLKEIYQAKGYGIKAVLLFGVPEYKDYAGTQAYKKDGIVQKAVKAVKKNFKDLTLITDVCLCAYTSHGHCRIMKKSRMIDADATLKVLAKIALSHAEAGADFVAPSAMMDGQVLAIRKALDKDGFDKTGIFAYSAKYASTFYAPFRDALNSAPKFGDRRWYQMDYRDSGQALKEIQQDIKEGADIVMVKPALPYLDIIYRAKQKFNIPIAAYSVSGEYAMVKEKEMILEIITAIKRAGADFIITYWGKDLAKWLKNFS